MKSIRTQSHGGFRVQIRGLGILCDLCDSVFQSGIEHLKRLAIPMFFCANLVSCDRNRDSYLADTGKQVCQESTIEDVAPNTKLVHSFKIMNSSTSSFAVTDVKAPCLCLFAEELVGVETPSGKELEVVCVLPIGTERTSVLLDVFTTSKVPELRHIQLKLVAVPKQTFFASPSSLRLHSTTGAATQELLIRSDEVSLIESFPTISTSNDLIGVSIVEIAADTIRLAVSINEDVAPMGRSYDCISFHFDDTMGSRIDVKTTIDRTSKQ